MNGLGESRMQSPPVKNALSDESLAKLRRTRQLIWKSWITGGVLGMLGGVDYLDLTNVRRQMYGKLCHQP